LREEMKVEVEAIVKFNDGVAFALKDKITFTYYKQGNLIIGLDPTCTFVNCYFYSRPSFGFEAFGGRKFDITLENGEVINCDGQWWDGGYTKAAELLGEELVHATYNDVESLKNCYVFYGSSAIKNKIEEMKSTYNRDIQGYWEYEAIMKGRDKPLR
jgi:hypothetical protein